MEFDGLTSEEIEFLKPQGKELILLHITYVKHFIVTILFLVYTILFVYFEVKKGYINKLDVFIFFIVTIIWWIFDNDYRSEIYNLKSGHYKRYFGYYCSKCHQLVTIPFKDIEKYSSEKTNCPNCNNEVILYAYKSKLKSYKKYLEKTK